MNDKMHVLFDCPFCWKGEGQLAYSAEQVVAYALEHPEDFYLELHKHRGSELVSHSYRPHGDTPCPHMVNFWIGTHVSEVLEDGRRSHREIDVYWEHSWFRDHDERRALREILWHDDEFGGSYPKMLHYIEDPNLTINVHDCESHPGWELDVSVLVKVALDPLAFLQEVRRAIEEEWPRTPSTATNPILSGPRED